MVIIKEDAIMSYTVYCHINRINNKKYIGVTSQSVFDRWQNGKHYSRHARFYEDIVKFGWDNFEHKILYTGLTKESAEDLERELISSLKLTDPDKGYNKQKGGKINPLLSDETREKLREINKGENNPFYNRKHTEETRRLMSERRPKKAVICLETQVEYKSTREAERQTNIYHSDISKACRGLIITAGGYHWMYKEAIA